MPVELLGAQPFLPVAQVLQNGAEAHPGASRPSLRRGNLASAYRVSANSISVRSIGLFTPFSGVK